MNQYVNGHTSYRVERVEDPHRFRRREPEYVLSLADDDEGLRTIMRALSKSLSSIVIMRNGNNAPLSGETLCPSSFSFHGTAKRR